MNPKTTLSRLAFIGLMGSSFAATAGYQMHAPGPMINLGKTSHPSSILSIGNNPAAGEALIPKDENMRMGYFSTLGFQVEFGEADNFVDLIDELKEDLEDLEDLEGTPGYINEALNLKSRFDDLLPVLGDDARLTFQTSLHAPLMPLAIRSDVLGGVISFGIQGGGIFDMSFLDDPLTINTSGSSATVETDSALYIKGGTLLTGSIGYSRDIWRPEFMPSAQVHGGVELNIYKASLNKQVLSIQGIIDDDEDSDIGDAARDEFDENTVDTTQVGLDVGFLMTMPNAQVGITFANINEPEFDYGDIGVNCSSIIDDTRRTNCNIAQQVFSDEIDLTETAVMNAQTTVEGAVFTRDKSWLVSGALDLNSTYDFVGRESQYFNVSASYYSDSYLIPNARFGLSKNLKGSELTTLGLGTTLFGVFNLDVAWSLDEIEVDGSKMPRHLGFNIGFEEKF